MAFFHIYLANTSKGKLLPSILFVRLFLAAVNWIICKGKRKIQLQIDKFWWALEREIRKQISPPRNPASGWISIKKSKSGFRGSPFYRSIGKSEKGFVKLFSWTAVLFLLILRARARLLFVRTVFQILCRISQSNKYPILSLFCERKIAKSVLQQG